MNMKKGIIIILLLSSLVLCSCASSDNSKNTASDNKEKYEIEDVINNMTEDMKSFNIAGLLNYASTKDFSEEDINNLMPKDELFNAQIKYLKENASKIQYKIESIEIISNEATAKVKYKYIDINNIIEKTITEYSILVNNQMSESEKDHLLNDTFNKVLNSSPESYITKNINLKFIKLDNKWYLKDLKTDLIDVMLSNYIYTFNKIEKKLN